MGCKDYQDTLYIVRRTEHHGSSQAFTLGGEFAWGNHPNVASVRGEVSMLVPTSG